MRTFRYGLHRFVTFIIREAWGTVPGMVGWVGESRADCRGYREGKWGGWRGREDEKEEDEEDEEDELHSDS